MRAILGLLWIYGLVNLGLVTVGVGIGLALHWLLPSIDLGTGVLIGVVATGFSIHYFNRLVGFSEGLESLRYEDDDLPPIQVYPVVSPRAGRKRKRK